jgi:hypothetical protein
MNTEDQFEQRLRRQPVKPIPSAWREEILSAARAAGSRPSTLDPRPSVLSTISHQLSTLLWPHPKAWAGLAAVWLVIFAVNFATADKTTVTAGNIPPASADTLKGLRHQEQLLAELNDQPEPREAERPKVVPPRPRSQRREEVLTA